MAKAKKLSIVEETKLIKIDLGCGTVKKDKDWIGVDTHPFDGVDVVMNMGKDIWPWEDGTVEEAHCSHALEHLYPNERVHFVNELYRVLKKGGKCLVVTPHWASCRAFGDMSHVWPPVSEFWYYYLNKEWRAGSIEKKLNANAPHSDYDIVTKVNPKADKSLLYKCDFDAVYGGNFHPMLAVKSQEFRDFAVAFYKEAISDLVATLTKK